MKLKLIVISLVVCALAGAWFGFGQNIYSLSQVEVPPKVTDESGNQVADYKIFLDLTQTGENELDAYLNEIKQGWHPGSATMLLEMTQVAKFHVSRQKIFAALEEKTGQKFGNKSSLWIQWIWDQEYNTHPQYSKFKHDLYHRADNKFVEYFLDSDNAKIRLDEMRWGGVAQDAIPPLKNPEMISVAEATYLADTDVVFGVSINGDHRCYPKRILAWHEMFKDTIGDVPICGAY